MIAASASRPVPARPPPCGHMITGHHTAKQPPPLVRHQPIDKARHAQHNASATHKEATSRRTGSARGLGEEVSEEHHALGPRAEAGLGIDVAGIAEVHEPCAPLLGQQAGPVDLCPGSVLLAARTVGIGNGSAAGGPKPAIGAPRDAEWQIQGGATSSAARTRAVCRMFAPWATV